MERPLSGLEPRQCLELLSWKVDVEWCGLICPQNQYPSQSSFSSKDVDWETVVTSLGLVAKSPSASSSHINASNDTVKVAGVVLLIGLGGYLCYKLYKVWFYHHFQGAISSRGDDNSPPPPSSFAESIPSFSYHQLSNSSTSFGDFLNVKTRYFGPLHLNNDDNQSETGITHYQDVTSPTDENVWWHWPREQDRKHKLTSPPCANSQRGWLLHRIKCLSPTQKVNNNIETKSPKRRSPGNSTGNSSSGSSPIFYLHQQSLSRDLSFDSLGLLCCTRRDSSIDSLSSELSFDMPSFTEQSAENVTVAKLDQLQQEIDQLKSNCQMMDEEFETVRCNRNLPGLSDLMEAAEHDGTYTVEDIVRRQSAKACFKGLYSLTSINHSMSIDLSLDDDSPQISNQFGLTRLAEEEKLPSLEWDEEYSHETDDQNNWTQHNHSTDTSSLNQSISCENGFDVWSTGSEMDSPVSDNGILGNKMRHNNIGARVDILSYAQQEWTGNTPKAKTILRVR